MAIRFMSLINLVNQFKVRLTGIDAPEKNQPYGLASTYQLSEAINNKWVFLRIETK